MQSWLLWIFDINRYSQSQQGECLYQFLAIYVIDHVTKWAPAACSSSQGVIWSSLWWNFKDQLKYQNLKIAYQQIKKTHGLPMLIVLVVLIWLHCLSLPAHTEVLCDRNYNGVGGIDATLQSTVYCLQSTCCSSLAAPAVVSSDLVPLVKWDLLLSAVSLSISTSAPPTTAVTIAVAPWTLCWLAPASNISTMSIINARHSSAADDTYDHGWKVSSEESDG